MFEDLYLLLDEDTRCSSVICEVCRLSDLDRRESREIKTSPSAHVSQAFVAWAPDFPKDSRVEARLARRILPSAQQLRTLRAQRIRHPSFDLALSKGFANR